MAEKTVSVMELADSVWKFEVERSELHAASLLNHLNGFQTAYEIILNSEETQQKIFVSSISKIFSLVDPLSQLAWSSLDVVAVFCHADGNQKILRQLQKLTPVVSNLLLSVVREDRKVQVLKVLQILTYGIQIPRTDSFVAPLIASLVSYKSNTQNSVIQLSLSVLANILHRNKVALYTLMQTVNLKDFMNDLLRIRSNVLCKMEVCKLIILLGDLICEKTDEEDVLNFVKVSFCTVLESASSGNRSHLLHCILFFDDMVNQKIINVEMLDKPWFSDCLEKVIELLTSCLDEVNVDTSMLLFKFLRIFVEMGIPTFTLFQQAIIDQGVTSVSLFKNRASEAILTVHCILSTQLKYKSKLNSNGMTEDQLRMVFLPLLAERNDYSFLSSVLDFLSTALEVQTYNVALKGYLEKEMIKPFLESLPSWNNFAASETEVKMYISLFHFVFKIVTCCDGSWMKFYTCLFSEQKVISTLAVALLYGSSELKGKVLSLVCSVGFPGESLALLAKSMADCGDCGTGRNLSPKSEENPIEPFLLPNIASIYFEANKLVHNIKESLNQKKDISTTQILDLYEYKEHVNLDYQKSLVASLTSATEEKSLLQEEIYFANQLTSEFRRELYCLRIAFDDMREKYYDATKMMDQNELEMSNLKNRLNEEMRSCQDTIQILNKTVETQDKECQKATEQIRSLKDQLLVKTNEIVSYENKIKCMQNKEDALTMQLKDHEKLSANLTKEIECRDVEIKSKSKHIVELEQEKIKREGDIQELERIRDTVFQLTGGKKPF